MSLIGTRPSEIPRCGDLGGMAWQDPAAVRIDGGRVAAQIHRSPLARTAAFTVGEGESTFLVTGAASVAVTLPDAATNLGREIVITNRAAFTVVSASSNVVARTGGAAGTAILPATVGAWALLVSDGSVWQIVAGS